MPFCEILSSSVNRLTFSRKSSPYFCLVPTDITVTTWTPTGVAKGVTSLTLVLTVQAAPDETSADRYIVF